MASVLLLVLSSCSGGVAVPSAARALMPAPTAAFAAAPSAAPGAIQAASPASAQAAPVPPPTIQPGAQPALPAASAADVEQVAKTPVLPTPSIDTAQAPGPPPPAPSLTLRKSSDTGVSDSDLLTGNNMPTFEGYAQVGTTVVMFDGAALLGTAAVDSTGYWAYMVDVDAGLNDGIHPLMAVAVDKAGRDSPPSAVLNLTIDTQPPAMPVITASTVENRRTGRSVTLSGTAPLSTTVTILEARAPLASTAVDATGAWTVTLSYAAPGSHDYRASATDAAGVTSPANNSRSVTLDGGAAGGNGGPVMTSPLATAGASSAITGTVVALAGGDIACGGATPTHCQQVATSNILMTVNPDFVLPLGDNQYECGSLLDYHDYYGPSWGRLLDRTHPAVGNHEYETSGTAGDPCYRAPVGAPGYFEYFGPAASPDEPGCTVDCKGYYSYEAGAWHVIVLNSICAEVGGCGLGSPEETWLKNDLAAHPTACTLAYWHYPRFSSGLSGKMFLNGLKAIWQDLYNDGVEIVLNGHDHDYERFSRLDANGNLDTSHGIREFVVGTGGRSHQDFGATAPWSQVRNNTTYGVLELRLSPGSYSWQFLPVAGLSFTDAGSEACRTW